jgi:hypothetical protein
MVEGVLYGELASSVSDECGWRYVEESPELLGLFLAHFTSAIDKVGDTASRTKNGPQVTRG